MMNYNNLYRGVVEANDDPKNLGRCRVRVPSIHGALTYAVNLLPWARPIVLNPVAEGRGSVNIPKLHDIVWVLFEGGDKESPVYIGGSYAINELPINKDLVLLYKEDKMEFYYDRPTSTLKLLLDDSSIEINEDHKITISAQDVDLLGNVCVNGVCPAPETEIFRLEDRINKLINPDSPDEPDQPDPPDEPDEPDQPDPPDEPDEPGSYITIVRW